MNRKHLADICSNDSQCYCRILEQSAEGITFSVDEGLTKPRKHLKEKDAYAIIKFFLKERDIDLKTADVVASSFENDTLCILGEDTLYQTILKCFAEHRPLILSPDMIWLVISQGLANHIDRHSSKYRNKIVSHKEKLDLEVFSPTEILSEKTDWGRIIDSFYSQIEEKTKGDIASTIACDFSTTGPDEKIVSIATLMTGLRTYFNYKVIYKICGIPQITLLGNADDWRKVSNKINVLRQFGLKRWYNWIEPIINEFVNAAEGKPNVRFWRSIVMTLPSDEFYLKPERRGCIPSKPMYIDGWFLALFLATGNCSCDFTKRNKDLSAESEMMRVGFTYSICDDFDGELKTHKMELWSGFVGVDENRDTYALKPRIGWFVRKSHQDLDKIRAYKSEIREVEQLCLNVSDVDVQILRKLGEIPKLVIYVHDNEMCIPKEVNKLNIQELVIIGLFSSQKEKELKKDFPLAEIINNDD